MMTMLVSSKLDLFDVNDVILFLPPTEFADSNPSPNPIHPEVSLNRGMWFYKDGDLEIWLQVYQ